MLNDLRKAFAERLDADPHQSLDAALRWVLAQAYCAGVSDATVPPARNERSIYESDEP